MRVTAAHWQALTAAAKAASARAWCPYSGFRVGAAVLAQDGRVFAGCNVENASYGLSMCAERNAVFHAVAEGMTAILAAVVYSPGPKLAFPCGACRQVLHEFAADAVVRCVCEGAEPVELALATLLPHAFGPGNLQPPSKE